MQEKRVRQATAGDLDQLLDLNEAVAAEGVHIVAEAPIDRESKRATYQ